MRGRAADTDFLGHRLRQRTAGRYRIGRRLGSGGMAAVYEAIDSLDRRWAIKVLSDMLLGQADMVDRFEREARTVLRLRHPNIVQLHAFEPHEDLHFLVLEFVEGESLADRIGRKDPIPLATALQWFQELAHALDYAHAQQVVHRDIKPDNVLIRKTGEAVIADFGIAKVLGAATGLTRTGTTVGTGYYMSPEQWVGGELTAAADQYSLGVVLFEALSGSRPFQGESLTALMTSHLSDEPPDLSLLRADVPLEVCKVIERMLAKEPGDRFPKLADALSAAGLATGAPEGRGAAASPGGGSARAAGSGAELIDVDAEEPEASELEPLEPDPGDVDPLEPDPIGPDPIDVEFVGSGAGSPSATEVVAPPPVDARAAARRSEPPVASGPDAGASVGGLDPEPPPVDSPGDAAIPEPRDRKTALETDDGGDAGPATGRRGLLVGGGVALLALLVWAISGLGSDAGGVVSLQPSVDSLEMGGPGEERIIQLDGIDADGDPLPVEGVRWSSEDPAVASVTSTGSSDARIAGVAQGGTWIRAVAGGLQARVWVRVMGPGQVAQGGTATSDTTPSGEEDAGSGGGAGVDVAEGGEGDSGPPPATPTRVALGVQGSLGLEVGESRTVRAAAPPGVSLEWVVDDADVARVRGRGSEATLEGIAPGRTVVRARGGDSEDSAPVVISAEAVAAVVLAPESVELEPGDRTTLRSTVRGVRSPNLDRAVEWTSREPSVATVDPAGVVESMGGGRTWIVARVGEVADSVRVTVAAPTTLTGGTVGLVAVDAGLRMAADFRVEPRATTVCIEGSLRFDGGDWVSLGRRSVQAGPGAARGLFESGYEAVGLPTVGNARRRVDPRARVWAGSCDGPAEGEPVEVMEAPPVCLVRYLARDWEVEPCE